MLSLICGETRWHRLVAWKKTNAHSHDSFYVDGRQGSINEEKTISARHMCCILTGVLQILLASSKSNV